MKKRSLGTAWKVALTAAVVMAMAMVLYLQLFERRSLREEDRISAARLEEALAESRARLEAEILAELRAELAKGGPAGESGDRPLPNAVLRRGESGGLALQQVFDSQEIRQAGLARLTRQMERSDRALRRNLEELRAEVRRERNVSGKILTLLLVAFVPLVAHFLAFLWAPGDRTRVDGRSDASGDRAS